MFLSLLYGLFAVLLMLYTFVVLGVPYLIVKKLLHKDEVWERYVNWYGGWWGRVMIAMTGSKVEVTGKENLPEGSVLLISNHQGNFDIFLVLGYIPKSKGFLAKAEIKRTPIMAFWMEQIHCIFIDRSKIRDANKYINAAVENLKAGFSMHLFPEGTRSQQHEMNRFKPGSFKLAERAKVPIVPVTLDGSYKAFEEKRRIHSARMKVTIHPPIRTDQFTKEDWEKVPEMVQKIIASAL